MKIVFAASAEIAVKCLELLVNCDDLRPAAVITNPDSIKGRKKESEPTEIGAAAEKLSRDLVARGDNPLKIFKPRTLDSAFFAEIAACEPDLLVSFAYGTIFTKEFLSIFPKGGLNVHPSLLPKHRGAAPVQAAILARDAETGISIQKLTEKLDSGGIFAQERIPLTYRETALDLAATVAAVAPAMLVGVLRAVETGRAAAAAQNENEATWCRELKKEDGRLDWNKSALEIDAQIRAFHPWPLSFTTHGAGAGAHELFILSGRPYDGGAIETSGTPGMVLGADKKNGILIETGCGIYCAQTLQYKTKKALDWKSFLNGARQFTGTVLG
jgi:methionyl-tRNA formyltransferase